MENSPYGWIVVQPLLVCRKRLEFTKCSLVIYGLLSIDDLSFIIDDLSPFGCYFFPPSLIDDYIGRGSLGRLLWLTHRF